MKYILFLKKVWRRIPIGAIIELNSDNSFFYSGHMHTYDAHLSRDRKNQAILEFNTLQKAQLAKILL
jgi:hypothetical protein